MKALIITILILPFLIMPALAQTEDEGKPVHSLAGVEISTYVGTEFTYMFQDDYGDYGDWGNSFLFGIEKDFDEGFWVRMEYSILDPFTNQNERKWPWRQQLSFGAGLYF